MGLAMKDISPLKNHYLSKTAKRVCGLDDYGLCTKSRCECAIVSEINAIMASIIPAGYRNFSIKDFDGTDDEGVSILSPLVAKEAKEKVLSYCWDDVSLLNVKSLSTEDLASRSAIGKRIADGCNVVIHGKSSRKLNENKDLLISKVGRTFIASILTKEAIKMRAYKGWSGLSYDWIEFTTLVSCLKRDEASVQSGVDWLVVDNISSKSVVASEKHQAFEQSVLDPFIAYRLEKQLPTVLVFRFDITGQESIIEDVFGASMARMIYQDSTLNICLSGARGDNGG